MANKKGQTESKDEVDIKISSTSPLIFISHDSRDAELAEAFSELLKSVSAGMLKSFRSSDKTGAEGIEYGDEWYKRLMSKLNSASDVVCLFTERSIDRPWILYEAGVAKGKLNTPVHGVALGIPLSRISTGPFYQFQNCGDSDNELNKLVLQLANRVPDLEPYPDVVKTQVAVFKTKVSEVLTKLSTSKEETSDSTVDDTSSAKILEEMKFLVRDLSSRIERQLAKDTDPTRRRGELFHFKQRLTSLQFSPELAIRAKDPLTILMIASVYRDTFPWLYEILMELYQAIKSSDLKAADTVLDKFKMTIGLTSRYYDFEEQDIHPKELERLLYESAAFLGQFSIMYFSDPNKERLSKDRKRLTHGDDGSVSQ